MRLDLRSFTMKNTIAKMMPATPTAPAARPPTNTGVLTLEPAAADTLGAADEATALAAES